MKNNALTFLKSLFSPAEDYKGVWPIQIYVLRLFFALMFIMAAKDAWAKLLTHEGSWNPEIAIAWCAMAAYTTMACLGIFNPLKMLPIMLFMYFYKGLWLFFVAYPLWSKGELAGSDAEGWVPIFMILIIPMFFTPWKYVFDTFVLGRD